MATPATLFHPNAAPEPLTVATQMPPVSEVAAHPVPAVSVAPGPVPGLVLGPTAGAVELDTVIGRTTTPLDARRPPLRRHTRDHATSPR